MHMQKAWINKASHRHRHVDTDTYSYFLFYISTSLETILQGFSTCFPMLETASTLKGIRFMALTRLCITPVNYTADVEIQWTQHGGQGNDYWQTVYSVASPLIFSLYCYNRNVSTAILLYSNYTLTFFVSTKNSGLYTVPAGINAWWGRSKQHVIDFLQCPPASQSHPFSSPLLHIAFNKEPSP